MRLSFPAVLLGIAIGGFFDGILLHQILQWHHLFSGVNGWSENIAFQITMDGMFHLAMFIALIVSLFMMRRTDHNGMTGSVFVGFGIWHVLDTVLSHWLLGIHRIRDAAENPMVWDLGWLAVFGIVPILLGLGMVRRGLLLRGAHYLFPLLAVGMGALNAFPVVQPEGPTIIAFAPGVGFGSVARAANAVGANLVQTDATGRVWAFDMPSDARWWRLYLHGAIMVGRGPAAGCLAWTEV